ITDPDLLCWWMVDEGQGTVVLDWSGHGNDGTVTGEPQWVDGFDGGALNFNGTGDDVTVNFAAVAWPAWTMAVWCKSDEIGQDNNSAIFSTSQGTGGGFQFSYDPDNNYRYHSDMDFNLGPATTAWVHLAVSYDGTIASGYYNGEFVGTFTPSPDDLNHSKFAIGVNRAVDNWFDGTVDEMRIYTKALTQEEVQLVMRIDPLLAWNPRPMSGATPDIDNATPLTWTRGDTAASHEVFFGLDRDAVADADTSDTTGVYRGRQNTTSFTPAEGVEWGGGPYYWRVDENNSDGTVTKGRVWSFTVADFILVDDFEIYTDDDANNEAIWQTWVDGFGVPANGSQVGYVLPPYAERTIVHGGLQSMPLLYDNTAGVRNSEVVLPLIAPRDWTKHGVGVLSLWFRGYPPSVGSFVEGPVGTFTMTGSGADIWGTSDEFHFAYKTLTGPGTIVARVNSIQNTHNWAKAGVMIRETLDADSKYSFALVSAASGVAAQGRTDTAISA
ncbi:MAG: LamG domain-containing protein, partial [Phycisphaerales bacterium]